VRWDLRLAVGDERRSGSSSSSSSTTSAEAGRFRGVLAAISASRELRTPAPSFLRPLPLATGFVPSSRVFRLLVCKTPLVLSPLLGDAFRLGLAVAEFPPLLTSRIRGRSRKPPENILAETPDVRCNEVSKAFRSAVVVRFESLKFRKRK
jgi:hypothetical protein